MNIAVIPLRHRRVPPPDYVWRPIHARRNNINRVTELLRKEIPIDSRKLRNLSIRCEGEAYFTSRNEEAYIGKIQKIANFIRWPPGCVNRARHAERLPHSLRYGFEDLKRRLANTKLWRRGFAKDNNIWQQCVHGTMS